MAWLDLQGEIVAELSDLSGTPVDVYDTGRKLESQVRRADPVRWAWEYAGCKRRRRQKRQAKEARRAPCPHCKEPVTRTSKMGKVPVYCSNQCTRAARFARWYAKHGQERNARRRKASP